MIVQTKKGDLPIKFTINALSEFGDLTNRSMNQVMEATHNLKDWKISDYIAFVYAGFIDGAQSKGEQCVVKSRHEVGEMMEDDKELLGKVLKVFAGDGEQSEVDSKKK